MRIASSEVSMVAEVTQGLVKKEDGLPRASVRNVLHIFRHDLRLAGRIRYSAFHHEVRLDGAAVTDRALAELGVWLDDQYGVPAAGSRIYDALGLAAHESPYHEVRDWLDGLDWDGTPRLDTLMTRYFTAEDTPLNRCFSAAWLIGAVARVLRPGCKLDTMVVFVGPQGRGKSSGIAALVPNPSWFTDTAFDINRKDAYLQIRGVWLCEIAEIMAIRRASAEGVKAFLSSSEDRFRRPYGRLVEAHPRQVVFIGTTNRDEFLGDDTGARRFWPVVVTGDVRVEAIARDREQLWAEAKARFDAGEAWWLDAEGERLLREVQQAHEEPEAWEPVLEGWVARQRAPFTVETALREALGLPVARMDGRVRQRVGKALARLGCVKARPRVNGGRAWTWSRPVGGVRTQDTGGLPRDIGEAPVRLGCSRLLATIAARRAAGADEVIDATRAGP